MQSNSAPEPHRGFQTSGVLLVSLCHFIHDVYSSFLAPLLPLLSTSPVMLAMVQDHCSSSPGAANGYYTMVQFMARSSVVVIVGFMGDLIGLRTAYLVSALLGLAGIPFVLLLPRKSEI